MSKINPNPFVVLALQSALRLGNRSAEINSFNPGDLRVDEGGRNHKVYVHAQNREDDFIPVDDAFVEAWRLCEAWSAEARLSVSPEAREIYKNDLFVYPTTNGNRTTPLARLNSDLLNKWHFPAFCKRWFNHKVRDEHGHERSLLHADRNPSEPLKINLRKLRNAFAVRFTEREPSRAIASQVMRHRDLQTLEDFYSHETVLDHAKRVHIALTTESQQIAMSLRNPIVVGISEETMRRAREKGAVTPHGLCGSALNDQGCARASNCLECPHLVIIESRRPRLVADRDALVKRAERFHASGDLRSAENALGLAKVCDAHLKRLDDKFNGENS